MAVNDSTLAIEKAARAAIDQITDAQARELALRWAVAWQQISNDLERSIFEMVNDPNALAEFYQTSAQGVGTLHPGIGKARSVRLLSQAAAQAGVRLSELLVQAGVITTADLDALVAAAQDHQQRMAASQLPNYVSWDWTRVDPRDLDWMVQRTTQQITQPLWVLSSEATTSMKHALVRGLGQGQNPNVIARRMIENTEGVFNGGLRRAIVIARTEQLDAYRDTSQLWRQQNADVVGEWMWVANLSRTICRSCLSKHGQTFPLSEPGPLDHQQGRCTAVPVTKSWADLGFPDVEDTTPAIPDAEAWLRRQPPTVQQDILTERGRQAWQDGHYPISTWSQHRTTEGWRDSWVPSAAPKDGGSFPAVPTRPKPLPVGPTLEKIAPVEPTTTATGNLPLIKGGPGKFLDEVVTTNPNYKARIEYQVNCTNCVTAAEHRARGFDVTAIPRSRGRTDPEIVAPWRTAAGEQVAWSNLAPKSVGASGIKKARVALDEMGADDSIPDGARGFITAAWKGGKSGHVWSWEKVDGKIVQREPQGGKSVVDYLNFVQPKTLKIVRVDNANFVGDPTEWMEHGAKILTPPPPKPPKQPKPRSIF